MTFCVGIKVEQGLVALADTQIVKGGERLSKGKLALVSHRAQQLFIMTSGLRSLRDKTVIYLEEKLAEEAVDFERLYQVAQSFGEQLRRVRQEDEAALAQGGLSFNLHAIIGGQLDGDPTPTLFYIYPEGNWIEATSDSPYFILGRTLYGRPILDRLLTADTPITQAWVWLIWPSMRRAQVSSMLLSRLTLSFLTRRPARFINSATMHLRWRPPLSGGSSV